MSIWHAALTFAAKPLAFWLLPLWGWWAERQPG